MAGASVHVTMGSEWRAVRDELQREDRRARERLGAELRNAMAPVVADVRSQALALRSNGSKHTGMRTRLAAGVRAEANGNNVRVVAASPGPGMDALPRGFDNGPKGWRHPVFGNRDVWVQQRGGSWFRDPIAKHHDPIERDLTNVLEGMAHRIAAAGHV